MRTFFHIGVKPSKTIVDKILKIDNGEILSLYGSCPNIIALPSAREASRLQELPVDDFKAFIKQVHDAGWKFSYTINGKCLGALINYSSIKTYLQRLIDLQVDSVIISNTFLLEAAKKEFPNLDLKVSTIAEARSSRDLAYFRKFKPSTIILSSMVNRDFAFLESIMPKADIELMANEVCLFRCPWRADHYNIESHDGSQCFGSFPFKNCFDAQVTDVSEFLKARFIRPEDVAIYEKLGFQHYKITGRSCSDERIVEMAKAYLQRRYEGNMLDLFPIVQGSLKEEGDKMGIKIPNRKMDMFLPMFPTKLNKNHRCDIACGTTCHFCEKYLSKIKGEF
jgi:collagenase-like PrtC family protease